MFTVAQEDLPPSIYPDPLEITWFEPDEEGEAPDCTDEENVVCSPQPDPPGGKESDEKVATDTYATGEYAIVHNWEAGLDLFARLEKNESLRNSEIWYQNFYAQADAAAIGDYVRVREQFKTLLSLNGEERQSTEALWTSIQHSLETLTEIGKAYSEATTEMDSTALEAAWLEQYSKVNSYYAAWQQLSADVQERIAAGIPALQAANAALPETIVPAANEKLMNAIQLQRIVGEPLTEKQSADVASLAFACPLEAGNAVYRARTLLRTIGDYVFDDAVSCGLEEEGKEETGKKSKMPDSETKTTESPVEWQIYPNPTKHQFWITGSQMQNLQSIQLLDGLGRVVLSQQCEGNTRMEIQLPTRLVPGVYFVRLQLYDGGYEIKKLFLQP